ncbi:ATP-binding protein [Kluyveromyces marxianus]|nr:ATP-binding protein [Kluyveromyces marxianus]KAG0684919.1 ATP-binding protein [Kluyveromyces marxianus]
MIRTGTRRISHSRVLLNASAKLIEGEHFKVPSPKKLKSFLDEYIVGQTDGKKVCSVAVYNHYLRVNDKQKKIEARMQKELLEQQKRESPSKFESSEAEQGYRNLQRQLALRLQMEEKDEDLELSKSNLMVVGPSGSGKTLLATTLARMLDVPIAITDCTQLTQAGYIGEDVEVCIERLLVNADYDVSKAEKGIIVLDEVDKLAKPAASVGTKDVSGEGVQQSLLKILEGHRVELTLKRPISKKKDDKNNQSVAKKEETFVVDTSNILFMLMGAFVGLDKHIVKRINRSKSEDHEGSELDKETDSQKLRFSNTIEHIDVGGGKTVSALNFVTPADLVSYGLIPELIGRVPIVTALEPLKQKDLYHILKEPRNALLHQYEYIFKQFGVTLGVTEKALKKVAEFALKEGTGARGLRGIMERLLLNVNYECPDSGVSYVLVNEDTVISLNRSEEHSLSTKVKAKYYSRGEQDQFMMDIYEEDEKLGKDFDKRFGRVGTLEKQGKS